METTEIKINYLRNIELEQYTLLGNVSGLLKYSTVDQLPDYAWKMLAESYVKTLDLDKPLDLNQYVKIAEVGAKRGFTFTVVANTKDI